MAEPVKTPPLRPKSQHWPQPAAHPEGPLTTVLADKQRLENMLRIEEEEHAASLRRMRQRWLEERQAEMEQLAYDGDEYPQTEVEKRRLVSLRARRRREEESIYERVNSGREAREARRRGSG